MVDLTVDDDDNDDDDNDDEDENLFELPDPSSSDDKSSDDESDDKMQQWAKINNVISEEIYVVNVLLCNIVRDFINKRRKSEKRN